MLLCPLLSRGFIKDCFVQGIWLLVRRLSFEESHTCDNCLILGRGMFAYITDRSRLLFLERITQAAVITIGQEAGCYVTNGHAMGM